MGITIHYKGKLDIPGARDNFLNEITEISNELGLKYDLVIAKEYELKGISISLHADSENLDFFVNRDGTLINPIYLIHQDFEAKHYTYNSTKTQFAPIDVHITIIKLLKYLKKKYISNLDVYDEGRYWETEDAQLLKDKLDSINAAMNILEVELRKIPKDKNETPESIADKIEKLFKDKFN